MHEFMPPKPFLFSHKEPNPLFQSKTHILGICTPFQCSKMSVWFRTTYFMSKTHVSCGFTPFRCRTWPIVKISVECIKCTSLCLQNHFLFCHNEHANPLFQSRTHVFGGSMPFRSRNWHVAKIGIEAHLMHEFAPLEPFLVFFCSKHAQSTTFSLKLMFGWFRAILLPHPTRCEN